MKRFARGLKSVKGLVNFSKYYNLLLDNALLLVSSNYIILWSVGIVSSILLYTALFLASVCSLCHYVKADVCIYVCVFVLISHLIRPLDDS